MAQLLGQGTIRKMQVTLESPVQYVLPIGKGTVQMNDLLGQHLMLRYVGRIECVGCGRTTRKSFNQGYCFPCFRRLAECDLCILRPETCHFHLGTCRDPTWAQNHCMQPHVVYIAHSSGLKVGITRQSQIPTRWIDQGAIQAIPIFRVKSRYHAGLMEATLKKYVSDRTDWRRMLKGANRLSDVLGRAAEIVDMAQADLKELVQSHPELTWEVLNAPVTEIAYPILELPDRISSLSFDKTDQVAGILQGIKGQYLLLDSGVINLRKFTGYEIGLRAGWE